MWRGGLKIKSQQLGSRTVTEQHFGGSACFRNLQILLKQTVCDPYTALQLPAPSNLIEPNLFADVFLFHCGLNDHLLKFGYAQEGPLARLPALHLVPLRHESWRLSAAA